MGQHLSGSALGASRLAFPPPPEREGRSATGIVSDREKPMAMPKDWGMPQLLQQAAAPEPSATGRYTPAQRHYGGKKWN
ncbi:hypothetical protein CRUP_009129 [Coryphaenoides rupestris]|nr:hypothetical protein CRUP_009129 [Coryphaenoides rupestris]